MQLSQTQKLSSEQGSVLILTLILLPILVLGIHWAREWSRKDRIVLQRLQSNDKIVKRAAMEYATCLDQVGKLNQTLKGLHITLNSLLGASVVLPAVASQIQIVRTAIIQTANVAKARTWTCALKRFPRERADREVARHSPVLLLNRRPAFLWWQNFHIEKSPVNGLPYQLIHSDLKSTRDIELRALDTLPRFSSKAVLASCGSGCTQNRWRFGG